MSVKLSLGLDTQDICFIKQLVEDLNTVDYFKLNPSFLLMDSNRDDPPFNQNQFSGFDEQDQYVGAITPLDKIQSADDPMSKNWGGHDVTIQAIKSGKYKNRTRQPAKF